MDLSLLQTTYAVRTRWGTPELRLHLSCHNRSVLTTGRSRHLDKYRHGLHHLMNRMDNCPRRHKFHHYRRLCTRRLLRKHSMPLEQSMRTPSKNQSEPDTNMDAPVIVNTSIVTNLRCRHTILVGPIVKVTPSAVPLKSRLSV